MESKEPKKWFAKAMHDYTAAKFNFEGKLFDVSAFLCQQAAEKALKAVYLKKFKKLKKIHDLVRLGRDVNLPENLLKYCKEMTAAYLYTRYPDIPPIEELEESSEAFIKWTGEIMEWTKKQL